MLLERKAIYKAVVSYLGTLKVLPKIISAFNTITPNETNTITYMVLRRTITWVVGVEGYYVIQI